MTKENKPRNWADLIAEKRKERAALWKARGRVSQPKPKDEKE